MIASLASQLKACLLSVVFGATVIWFMFGCSERGVAQNSSGENSNSIKAFSQVAVTPQEPKGKTIEKAVKNPIVSPAEGHPEALRRIKELLDEAFQGSFSSLMTLGQADANKQYIIRSLYDNEAVLLSRDDRHMRYYLHVLARLGDADARKEIMSMLNSKVYISEESALQALAYTGDDWAIDSLINCMTVKSDRRQMVDDDMANRFIQGHRKVPQDVSLRFACYEAATRTLALKLPAMKRGQVTDGDIDALLIRFNKK